MKEKEVQSTGQQIVFGCWGCAIVVIVVIVTAALGVFWMAQTGELELDNSSEIKTPLIPLK